MALIKLNNRGVKDATVFGSISSLGELTFISKQTASASATIDFTSGIDSSYKEYIFYFVNMHPATNTVNLTFQTSTNGGSSYGVTNTSTAFNAYHREDGGDTILAYDTGSDFAQSTSFIRLNIGSSLGNDNDESLSGYLHLFNPSSTTFVKHWISNNNMHDNNVNTYTVNSYTAGYFNTTSALDAVQFKMSSGNIDSGEFLLFGLS